METKTLITVLETHVRSKGDEVLYSFIHDDESAPETLTYRQLYDQAHALALRIAQQVRAGERALMLFENDAAFVISFIACLMAGVVAVPVYPPRRRDDNGRVASIARNARPSVILATAKVAALSEQVLAQSDVLATLPVLVVDAEVSASSAVTLPLIHAHDLAFLQYSSGSSGTPKGVMVSHANILHNQACLAATAGNTADSSIASWLPYFHDMGLSGGILQPLYIGFPGYLMNPNFFLQKPIRWLRAMSDYQIRNTGAPNFAWDICVEKISDEEMVGLDLSHWKVAYHGAEPIKADTLRRFHQRFGPCGFDLQTTFPSYGMAEATLLISGKGVNNPLQILPVATEALSENRAVVLDAESNRGPDSKLGAGALGAGVSEIVSCGIPWCDSELRIVDPESKQRLEDGRIGEIWLASDSVALGYWDNPEATDHAFHNHIAGDNDPNNGHYLRTGDLGFLWQGQLYVTGRLKDLIIIRGRNYYPQDIETAATAGDAQLIDNHCAAFSVDGPGGEAIVVVVEVQRTALRNIDGPAAIKRVRERIGASLELAVDDVVLIKTGSIARTSSGKIRRSENKRLYLANELNVIASARVGGVQVPANPAQSAEPTTNRPSPSKPRTQDAGYRELALWLKTQIAQLTGLALAEVAETESFLALGINSLMAVQLSSQLGERMGINISPTVFYDYPSIARLCDYLLPQTDGNRSAAATHEVAAHDIAGHDIAIIGMACRFPGADSVEQFWDNLRQGRSSIRPFPQDRYYGYVPEGAYFNGGYLDQVDYFDNGFFNVTAKEAKLIDPQHRLLLELAHNSLRHAGYQPQQMQGSRTGVFVGISQSEYVMLCARSAERASRYLGTGTSMSMAANRISYFYDFIGPSQAVDTACSSSLVALHEAVKALRDGECEQALAGGVKLVLFTDGSVVLKNAAMLSATGACHAFDGDADGYSRAEGAGMVVLKPLNHAQRDGDRILAVIKGTAVNQDGRSNGITAPSGLAQQRVIEAALADAQVAASQVSYVEAHGTGTPLGDPIEVNALAQVYGAGRAPEAALLIGSAKANIGHLEPAAGMAGLIKTILCLQHQQLVKQIHFQRPNPHIAWEQIPVRVCQQAMDWPRAEADHTPVYAGVSSFGFGGTNSHVILQQAPAQASFPAPSSASSPDAAQATEHTEQQPVLLALQAKDGAALNALSLAFARHIEQLDSDPENPLALAQLCSQFNQQLEPGELRLALLASDRSSLCAQLRQQRPGSEFNPAAADKLAFMFTGQGSQYPAMGRPLYRHNAVFRAALDACEAEYQSLTGHSLLALIFSDDAEQAALIDQTRYTQPALFALQYALAQLWLSWGVRPQWVLGHSIGEYAAACIAGVFSLSDALRLVVKRGELIQALPAGGGMLAVRATAADLAPILSDYDQLDYAAHNGPESLVISGAQEQLMALTARLEQQQISCRALNVSHAFHSPLMAPVLEEFRQVAQQIQYQPPQLAFVSSMSGQLESADLAQAEYWVQHIRRSVLFEQAVLTSLELGAELLLEIGPDDVLTRMTAANLKQWPQTSRSLQLLPSLRKALAEEQQVDGLWQNLARGFELGLNPDWSQILPAATQRLPLPAYPFKRSRHWVTVDPFFSAPEKAGQGFAPQAQEDFSSLERSYYQQDWQAQNLSDLSSADIGASPQHWLILQAARHDDAVLQQLPALLAQQGVHCTTVVLADGYAQLGEDSYQLDALAPADYQRLLGELAQRGRWPQRVVDAGALLARDARGIQAGEIQAGELLQRQGQHYAVALSLMQAVLEQTAQLAQPVPRLALLSRDSQRVLTAHATADTASPLAGWADNSLWGLAKVLMQEHPELACCNIDLQDSGDGLIQAQLLLQELRGDGAERQLAYVGAQRYVARLQALELAAHTLRQAHFDAQRSYLLTGGTGDLALATAEWLVQRGARHLHLLARRAPAADSATAQRLAQLRQAAEVSLALVDVSDGPALADYIQQVQGSAQPLAGVFHFAGALDDKALMRQQPGDFLALAAAKGAAAWQLHQLTRDCGLDYFVMLSSAAALFGSPGQANYAAANAMLDGLSQHRAQLGLPSLCIQLGMVSGIGMAARRALDVKAQERGMPTLSSAQFLHALQQLVAVDTPLVGLVPVHWPLWQEQIASWPYLARFAQQPAGGEGRASVQIDASLVPQIKAATDVDQRAGLLERYLSAHIAQIGEFGSGPLDRSVSLLNLGLDSLMLVELQRRVKNDFALAIGLELLLKSESLRQLAASLSQQLAEGQGGDGASASQSTPAAESANQAAATTVANAATENASAAATEDASAAATEEDYEEGLL